MSHEPGPIGAIFNTNSRGRFDLVIYNDGILGVRGSYWGVALRAGGVGMVGAGGGGVASGAVAGGAGGLGSRGARSYETKRLSRILSRPRHEIIDSDDRSFFIQEDVITKAVLRKRWHGCSLTIKTDVDTAERDFSWKPALNNFAYVRDVLTAAIGERLVCE